MARIIKPLASAASSFMGWLRGKTPSPTPKPTKRRYGGKEQGPGQRGVAAGNLKPGMQDVSAENVAKWETISGGEVEKFLYDGLTVKVHSTNVDFLRYDYSKKRLFVGFLNGSEYWYDNVSEDDAYLFMTYPSKGGAVWDLLRIRGTRLGHKKPYHRYQ